MHPFHPQSSSQKQRRNVQQSYSIAAGTAGLNHSFRRESGNPFHYSIEREGKERRGVQGAAAGPRAAGRGCCRASPPRCGAGGADRTVHPAVSAALRSAAARTPSSSEALRPLLLSHPHPSPAGGRDRCSGSGSRCPSARDHRVGD
jgi:hypothetical protein